MARRLQDQVWPAYDALKTDSFRAVSPDQIRVLISGTTLPVFCVPDVLKCSLHSNAFRQVPWFVHIGAARAGRVVGQQLQWHHMQHG